jgi:mRNA-degrading endonuclease RelE of RelBE toxin-antitoxin system
MEYEYQSSFVRDAKKLPKNIKEGIVEIIDNIQSAEQLSDIEGVTKMVGYSNSYRFKVKSIKDFRRCLKIIFGKIQFLFRIIWQLVSSIHASAEFAECRPVVFS